MAGRAHKQLVHEPSTRVRHRATIQWRYNWESTHREYVFWVCATYMLGSVCGFWVDVCSCPALEFDRVAKDTLVSIPRFGSPAVFAVGAWVSLYMWKAEQFGLGFIREINEGAMDGRSGPRAVDSKQQIFLFVYVCLGVLSIIDISSTASLQQDAQSQACVAPTLAFTGVQECLTSSCFFLTAHTILWLATIVHRTPLAPYGYMLWCMRAVAVLYLATALVRTVWILDGAGTGPIVQGGCAANSTT